MSRSRVAASIALALAAASAQGADIVLTPPAGGGFRVTNSPGDATRFRILEDGTVVLLGDIFKGGDRFLHNFGTSNTFLGIEAGNFTMTGIDNFGSGYLALRANTTGYSNTASGRGSMLANTIGYENTAHGANALHDNVEGSRNVAVGNDALFNNISGTRNVASGASALYANTAGQLNVAIGFEALRDSKSDQNVAVGTFALNGGTTGSQNIAVGFNALGFVNTGSRNIGLGWQAGFRIVGGSNNIAIGSDGGTGDEDTIRLGDAGHLRAFIGGIRGKTTGNANAIPVMIDSNGQLGTVSSSVRFKDDIADMGDATSDLMKLRPVTFHYLADQEPAGRTLQYGLVAEEVAEVYPGLVARTPDGQVETVMYQFLPSMLLNEFQKQQRELAELRAELNELKQMLRRQP